MNREILIIAALAAGTVITRFLPFIVFPGTKETPAYIEYLGKTLPYATIGLLVVYCLKDINLTASPFALPEIIAIAVIVILHNWKRNSLLSIGSGTLCYMVLVQKIFMI